MNTTLSPTITTTGTYTTPVTSNNINYYPWGYQPYYPQFYPMYIDRSLIKWKCGNCGSSCAGYISAGDAEDALLSHRRSCVKAK